jgi:hypothetical protein
MKLWTRQAKPSSLEKEGWCHGSVTSIGATEAELAPPAMWLRRPSKSSAGGRTRCSGGLITRDTRGAPLVSLPFVSEAVASLEQCQPVGSRGA